mgnify:CR=1 FL=1
MKKTLIILIILCGFLFIVSCRPNPLVERKTEGTIIAVSQGNFFGLKGSFIVWEKGRAATKWYEQGPPCQVWFIYPPQEELIPPVKIQLIYRWNLAIESVPIVRVITCKKLTY